MKIIEKVLKNKLQILGYDIENISDQLKQIDFDIVDNQITFENEAENYINIREYDEPTVEIARMLINYNKYYIQSMILSGEVNLATSITSINSVLPIVNYRIADTICIVAITAALNVEVLSYKPSMNTIQQYGFQTYEEAFSDERNKIAREYYDAFVENGRVAEHKVKGILSLLLAEYIIDELAITGANPKIKMYDNVEAYAENITEYRLKYINRRTNRIELAYRPTYIKRLGANVMAGLVSNDPYIKLDSIPKVADFPLNMVSCYWTEASRNRKEEIAIYIATKPYGNAKTYREYYENNEKKYDELIEALTLQFQRETNKEVSREYIAEVLKKLNPELLSPSMDILRDCMDNPSDPVEPLRYKFKSTSMPEDFEDKLYISIEDNMGKRYKYKLTENILEDLTRIGNKLEYTNEEGQPVRKQSIADFNVNANTAIIRRETIIDYTKIPGLLGYIYEDMEYLGTDMLPVPSIEVDFYFPQNDAAGISMYNGTSFDMDMLNFSNSNKFNDIGNNESGIQLPGTTYATVKYVNSKGEILKENKILNLFPGTPYVPEILPIINDVDGGEWICSTTQYPTTVINVIPEYNVIEIKYKEKISKVTLTFLNREGKKIRDDFIETVQTGTMYDIEKRMQYTDEEKNDWKLITARPQKLLVKDDESKNHLILVYDLEKETVTVKYLNSLGEDIIEPNSSDMQIGKKYDIPVERILVDAKGFGWIYNGTTPISHLVEEEKENLIEIQYEEYKLPVVVKYQTEDGVTILNDKKTYLQMGSLYSPEFDEDVTDFNCKKWKFKKIDKENFVVSKNVNENIIKVLYEPLLARVTIQILDEFGKKIINPIEKFGQIGDEFSSISIEEITDNYGRLWKKIEDPNSLVVSQNEAENNISIKYEPLITTVTVKFFDDERNELIPSKKYERQAGTLFKPEIIEKLESSDGRKWFLNHEKLQEYGVKKNVEENIVSIFYEKELTDINLEFLDAYGKSLRDNTVVKAQIGSVFNEKMFNKIEDRDGGKWMIESTEPKKLVVKSANNNFKLYYGEVKAIVVVKHINVKTNQTILKDIVAKVKLGGVYIPNIQERVLDTDKCLWSFVGDKNMSIIVNENEQENIVLLQYEEALAKVNVKYQDLYNNKLRDDVTYELQIGKDIDYKKLDKFIDINGMGWKIESSKTKMPKVMEENNEVINYYNPLKTNIKVTYLNDKNEEIKNAENTELQVGRTFKPTYDNRIKDVTQKLWMFKEISEEEVKAAENGNVIEIRYLPVLSKVAQRFLSKTGEAIGDDDIRDCQVGSVFDLEIDNIFVDKEKKKWNFVKTDCQTLQVKEDETQNIINNFYEPRMSNGIIKIYDDSKNEIMQEKKYTAQIGSAYTAKVAEFYIDPKTKLGWTYLGKPSDTIIVDDESSNNLISINYEKHMMKVRDRMVDMEGKIIIPDNEKLLQVGKTYDAKIVNEIKDAEGKEWIYNGKNDGKLLGGGSSNTSIIVSDKDEQNVVFLKYKPLLANGIIKYQDNLGNVIASREEFSAQVGSSYTPNIKEVIVDIKKNKWVYNPNSKSTIIISRDEKQNVVTLSYEEEKAPIIYKYKDEYNNRLKAPKKVLAQIGSIFVPDVENVIEDEHGKVWEFKATNVEKIEVKDSEQDNVIEVTYIPLYVDAILNIKNRKDELISRVTQKAQLGSTFKPSLDEDIYDEDSMLFRLVKCEPEELLIREVPIGSTEEINVFDVTYEPVYSNVVIVYQDINGNELKDNEEIQLQVGTKYTPKLVQFVKDRKGIQWENVFKEVDTIRVKENQKENIIKMTFELAKAEVLVRFRDIDGNSIKDSDQYQENIGVEFVPKIDNIIEDSKHRKWVFSTADPVKLNVGSINNIINLVYQEKKSSVTIKFETVSGKKLREDMVVSVQEGVQYVPKKNFAVIYDENDIWRYLEFRPSSLLVTDNEAENVIIQVYDNKVEKVVTEENKLVNPFANTLTEEEKQEMERIEEKKLEAEKQKEPESLVEFTDNNLIELSKNILLEDNEKTAIEKINQINKNIISKLDSFRSPFDINDKDTLVHDIDELMQQEKDIIEKELSNMIENDKTGKKFLKVLEAIVSLDVSYSKMQERKIILLTDYFVNPKISNIEQATYICERGKNTKEILIMGQKINAATNDREKLQQIYVELLYERSMLDSYYRTRTKSKDEYFESEVERNSVGSDIVILVTNMLPNQAYKLLQKVENLTIIQQNELDAIVNLLTTQQRTTLDKMINETKDNRLKKSMIKKMKSYK